MKLPPLYRGLPVPPRILALVHLPLTTRLVLAEAFDLERLTGSASAPNTYYARRLHCGERTVGQAIAQLVAAGHLVRRYAGPATHGRHLTVAVPRPRV